MERCFPFIDYRQTTGNLFLFSSHLYPVGIYPFISIPLTAFPASFLPFPFGFIRCKGLLSRLIHRFEVHFLQILPFYERVIGRKNRCIKLYRQLCTASIKPQSGSGRKRTDKRENKKSRTIKFYDYGNNSSNPSSREKHRIGSIGRHSAEQLQPTQEL